MKINTATDAVLERDGLASDGEFGIIFNAKMAKILSDGLYSDKIGSIIRELCCNAIDSHVDAGKRDVPIEVHLPTMFEPFFHVRDVGTGLDHDQVIKIYTVYGASTKTNSNEFIGQLGLGSKSPFSYVDAFDVTARKDGIERQYSCYKNEKGMPSIALLGEQATGQTNGVTVKMPVRQEDIHRFSEKAQSVLKWFETVPNVTGVSDFVVKRPNIRWQGNGWQVRTKLDNYYHNQANRPIALMGRVAYPLDANSLANITQAQRAIMSLPLTLLFDIGELEVAASREALGYDNRTQANIKSKLDVLITELSKAFEDNIAIAKTEWEARKLFGEIFGHEGGMSYDLEQTYGKHGLKWKGKLIKDQHISFKTENVYVNPSAPNMWTLEGGYKRARSISYHREITMRCSNRIMIVFDDLERGGLSRVSYLHEQNDQSHEIYVFGHSNTMTHEEILDMLGNPPFKLTSELPKRPTAERQKISMLKFKGGDGAKAWVPVDVDLEDGGVYVNLNRYTVQMDKLDVDNFDTIVKLARDSGMISGSTEIYAPRGTMRASVTEHDDWEDFFDHIKEKTSQQLTQQVMQAVADMAEFNKINNEVRDASLWQSNLKIDDQTGAFARFVNAMRNLSKSKTDHAKHSTLISLAGYLGKSVNQVPPSANATQLFGVVKVLYPMLMLSMDSYSSYNRVAQHAQTIADYINIIDRTHSVQINEAVAAVITA